MAFLKRVASNLLPTTSRIVRPASRLLISRSVTLYDPISRRSFDSDHYRGIGGYHSNDSFTVWFLMPALTRNEIKLTVNADRHSVEIKFTESAESEFRKRFLHFPKDQEVPMPKDLKLNNLKAELKNGILRLVFPM